MAENDSSTSGYDRRKKRKREQILTAATGLFSEGGFARTSITRIAEAAAVSPVTIYNHFGDKYALVEAVVIRMAEGKIEEYRRILSSPRPWLERLRTVIIDKKKTLRMFRGEYLLTLYRECPSLVERMRDIQLDVREGITYPFLDEGRRLGTVPAYISNDAVATFLQLVMRGFDESPEILDRISEDPALFDQVYDLITYGMVLRSEQGPAV